MAQQSQQYRIRKWFDGPRVTYSTPTFTGETGEECDQKAIAHFNEVSGRDSNAWEGMDIVRIDAPAIPEKITLLAKNGRQE